MCTSEHFSSLCFLHHVTGSNLKSGNDVTTHTKLAKESNSVNCIQTGRNSPILMPNHDQGLGIIQNLQYKNVVNNVAAKKRLPRDDDNSEMGI